MLNLWWVRNAVVERSVEEYAIDQPIGIARGGARRIAAVSDSATAEPTASPHADGHAGVERYPDTLRRAGIEGICTNPLREEPHPAMVTAVRRFGVVGLIGGAVCAALLRGWRSLVH